jgi:hypothetical protein
MWKNKTSKILLFGLGLLLFVPGSMAQTFNLNGYVKDAQSGETLVGAAIFLADDPGTGVLSNTYGYYALRLPAGKHRLKVTYLGYQTLEKVIELTENINLDFELQAGLELQTVEVSSQRKDANVESTRMGQLELPVEKAKKLPALMGEVDILKVLQLLPGVRSAGEGNAGFFVRGGGADQNLVLLDEAVVYNSGHLLGFFSVFNADAIKNAELLKGSMPAAYGGRLSSVVDVQMKEGNDQDFSMEGGLGLIASRLTLQGPIQKDHSSFILTGRRTYALDLAQPFIKNTDFAGTNYYFYDLNAKVNHRFSAKDRLFLSGYFGRDVLKFRNASRDFYFDLPYGNSTATLRWNHLFSQRLFMNATAVYNDYDFRFAGGQDNFGVDAFSGVRDWNFKMDFDWFPSPKHTIKYGANYTYHRLTPSVANAISGEQRFSNNFQPQFAHEGAFYLQDDAKLSARFKLNLGIRLSWFAQVGPYTSLIDGQKYEKGEPVKSYAGPEPRFALRYSLTSQSSLKASVTAAYQYLHLVSNSTSTLPFDIWVPSSEYVKPQFGWQYALGYFRNFSENALEFSFETYYRSLSNQIDYGESYVNNAADNLEEQFVFGTGRAYGFEFLLRKNKGRLNGWIGYTLARTERQFPNINEGRAFPTVFDRRHDLSVVANYQLSKKWELSGVFVYGQGRAFTPVQSLYLIGQNISPNYGPRNSARLPDYHRMDIAATFTPGIGKEKKIQSAWVFSVYNTYSRLNPFFVYYRFDTDTSAGTAKAEAIKVALFPVIPTVTWNFKLR